MPITPDVVEGSLKIKGLPDLACFTSMLDFLKALPTYYGIEIPNSITNVIVSNVEPLDTQRDFIWFRRSNSGSFLGIYLYASGSWKQAFPAPQQIFWMYGDSRDVPDGYLLVGPDNPNFTAGEVTAYEAKYIADPTNTYYVYFATTFEGL